METRDDDEQRRKLDGSAICALVDPSLLPSFVDEFSTRLVPELGNEFHFLHLCTSVEPSNLAFFIHFLLIRLVFLVAVHVEGSMDYKDPSFVEALERETAILAKRVAACKSRILIVTSFASSRPF